MRHDRMTSTLELKKLIVDSDKPIYVQSWFNRFAVGIICEEEDCILLVLQDEADNPL